MSQQEGVTYYDDREGMPNRWRCNVCQHAFTEYMSGESHLEPCLMCGKETEHYQDNSF
jgi:hypothetical protein